MSVSSVPDFGMTTSCVSLPTEGRYRVTSNGNGEAGCECEQEHLLAASRTAEQLSPTHTQLSLSSRRICLHDTAANGDSRCFNGLSAQSITRDCTDDVIERHPSTKTPDLLSNGGGANGLVYNRSENKRPSELGDIVYIRTKLLDGLNYNGSAYGGGDGASTLRSFRSASPFCSPDDVSGSGTGTRSGADSTIRELSEGGFRYNNGAVWTSSLTSASGIRSTTPALPRSLTSPPGADGDNGRGLVSPLDYRLNSLMLPATLRESNI